MTQQRIAACDFTYEGKWYKEGVVLPVEMYSLPGAKVQEGVTASPIPKEEIKMVIEPTVKKKLK